ncbi:RIIa domain-containing protein 1 [Cyprinodon tularosa]|uniref:RIIa domain-containing protein 1 n=1 Tax=Cyprinodon tularosa TaxID=77115 RepID=UPI0018E235D0|nr:RIIa domain-containing protein 1 [Cyprinodon tularosa]
MAEDGKGAPTTRNVGPLSPEQEEKLKEFKMQTRLDNERYLRAHPEVDEIIGEFLRQLLVKRPSDIEEFAADHFSSLNDPSGSRITGNNDED